VLNAEEAAARLKAVRDPDWRTIATERVRRLPLQLRGPADAFITEPDRYDAAALRVQQERRLQASVALDELPGDGLRDVMRAMHPGLGNALATWWVDAQSRPYQHGWGRRAFRAPNAPEVTRQNRTSDLLTLLAFLGPHTDADPAWLAAWGGHLGVRTGSTHQPVGGLLASAITHEPTGSSAVVDTLMEVGNGEHPLGVMGRHVIVALLNAGNPRGWDYIQRMLLAAQRQEGLRQAILESADEAHPEAFELLLTTVLDHGLLRFPSAVRAVCVWLGFNADVTEIPMVEDRVRTLLALRKDEAARKNALRSSEPWDTYIALCVGGMRDAVFTTPEAAVLLDHTSPQIRATAVRFASAMGLVSGQHLLVAALDDPDLAVSGLAASQLTLEGFRHPDTFDALARLVPRLPEKPRAIDGVGVEAAGVMLDRQGTAGRLVSAVGNRSVVTLLPWLREMDPGGRWQVARRVGDQTPLTTQLRQVLLDLLADRSSMVRRQAIEALCKTPLEPGEAAVVEALLTRSATDVRRAALTLLASLPHESALSSVDRLAASSHKGQREAGAELARAFSAEFAMPPNDEHTPGSPVRTPTPAEDLRGTLVDEQRRTPSREPRAVRPPGSFSDDTARRIVDAIDDIAETQKNTPVLITSWQGSTEILFGDLHRFPSPFAQQPGPRTDDSEEGRGLLLADVFRSWWADRPKDLVANPETDALRAYITVASSVLPYILSLAKENWWVDNTLVLVGDVPINLRYRSAIVHVLDWLMTDDVRPAAIDECLDAVETLFAMVPPSVLAEDPAANDDPGFAAYRDRYALHHKDWRMRAHNSLWDGRLSGLLQTRAEVFSVEQLARWFGLMRWLEQPHPGATPLPVDTRLLTAAHAAGVASDHDVIVAFLHPRIRLFHDLTRHWRTQLEARYPALAAIADLVRDRVVAVEMQRGDLPTPTSPVALNVGSVSGVDVAIGLLQQLGKATLQRGWIRTGSDSKDAVLSHLIRVSFPSPVDTPQSLTAAARAAKIPDARLVDLAIYAPQWAEFVEHSLGWPGLASGVLWLHAHTKDAQWSIDLELRQSWAAMVAERTPLSADDLVSGAVDVDWFRECYTALGEQRWRVLHKAAKNASAGNGHRRAQVFAEAMLGQVDEASLVERVRDKRNQDAVRALGLLPLPETGDAKDASVQRRYADLCEFERGTRQFGSQRQHSERTAMRIGVDNLARTAGYADPSRFIWAVEAAEAGDLADGPVTVSADDITLTLSVDEEGVPNLVVHRGERTLQSVPAPLRKHASVVELRARKTALTRQVSRVRNALEAAMIAQDSFTDDDFAALNRHPIVAPMLDQLVWVDERGRAGKRERGRFVDTEGARFTPGKNLRLAHPVDLLGVNWMAWQEHVFAAGRRQPFKQVFRELYVVTDAERGDLPISHRYGGHQLQPRQALALFTRRGWLTSRESGDVSRVFHRHGIAARVEFVDGFLTPMEADLPTIGGVYFTRRGEHLAQPLDDVPPIVFSETMRDLDLVVSIAHAGGVDPEATASTTEMRAALIREMARLMKLTNLSFSGTHVLVEGSLGEYSVHLGSGTVHRRPGGSLCIVPVGSQHRGRLFLPFADDDPKTAEIVAKTLLLARDREIKDPTILEQLQS
jgi:hypothetical protein